MPEAGGLPCSALTPDLSSPTDGVSRPLVALPALSTMQMANLGEQGRSVGLGCYCDAPLHTPDGDGVPISPLV